MQKVLQSGNCTVIVVNVNIRDQSLKWITTKEVATNCEYL